MRLLELSTGQTLRTYRHQPPRYIDYLLVAPDGKHFVTHEELPGLVTQETRRTVSLWNRETGQCIALPDTFMGNLFTPDSRALAGVVYDRQSQQTTPLLLDAATGQRIWSLPARPPKTSLFFRQASPDGKTLIAEEWLIDTPRDTWQGRMLWIDATTGHVLGTYEGGTKFSALNASFSSDGRWFALSRQEGTKGKLHLFRVSDRQLVWTVDLCDIPAGARYRSSTPLFYPQGKYLLVHADATPDPRHETDLKAYLRRLPQLRYRQIDLATGQTQDTLVMPQGVYGEPVFSPDGQIFAISGQGRVYLWELPGLSRIVER